MAETVASQRGSGLTHLYIHSHLCLCHSLHVTHQVYSTVQSYSSIFYLLYLLLPFLPSPLRGCLFGFPPYLPLPSSLHLDRTPSLPLWLIFFSLPSLHSIYPLYSHLLNTATLQLRPH